MRGLIKLPKESCAAFMRLGQFKYIVDDGKVTKNISSVLRSNGVDFYHGYDQAAKKVVLALNSSVKIEPCGTFGKNAFFKLKR